MLQQNSLLLGAWHAQQLLPFPEKRRLLSPDCKLINSWVGDTHLTIKCSYLKGDQITVINAEFCSRLRRCRSACAGCFCSAALLI